MAVSRPTRVCQYAPGSTLGARLINAARAVEKTRMDPAVTLCAICTGRIHWLVGTPLLSCLRSHSARQAIITAGIQISRGALQSRRPKCSYGTTSRMMPNVRLQPRRLRMAPTAVGCKPMLDRVWTQPHSATTSSMDRRYLASGLNRLQVSGGIRPRKSVAAWPARGTKNPCSDRRGWSELLAEWPCHVDPSKMTNDPAGPHASTCSG